MERMEIGFGGMDGGVQSALKSLDSHFAMADARLQWVHQKLANEFEGTYPGNANPLKLLARTERLQDELPLLREECDKILAAKQNLIDLARTTLVKNRTLLRQLQGRAGLPVTSDADDPIYSSFVKTIEEWDQQVKANAAVTDIDQSELPDLNLELFRANRGPTW
ncbi:hypothetical protein M758_2G221600 [Ceratodon purpureus]|nr:hypothetical protein M758_2G221600 [Ceratodon purpureus]